MRKLAMLVLVILVVAVAAVANAQNGSVMPPGAGAYSVSTSR